MARHPAALLIPELISCLCAIDSSRDRKRATERLRNPATLQTINFDAIDHYFFSSSPSFFFPACGTHRSLRRACTTTSSHHHFSSFNIFSIKRVTCFNRFFSLQSDIFCAIFEGFWNSESSNFQD